MESLIISYSFFEPKSLHREMRTWDLYNNQDRYWYNIPALMAINSVVYPDAKIKIHISNNIKSNKYFEILEKIADNFGNIELVNLDYDYRETEPTMWRYKPLFDKESDIVLCRDIDSLPNSDEIKATYYFLNNSQYYVHTLRTHTNHVIPHTIILAGLCGYRPNKIEFLQNISFEISSGFSISVDSKSFFFSNTWMNCFESPFLEMANNSLKIGFINKKNRLANF
jgi:hypothetical protein